MDKEFIPYEQALELRELDFNEECLALYYVPTKGLHYGPTKELITQYTEDVRIVAPTFSQAFRWFRENFSLDVTFRKMEYGLESNFTGYYFSIYRGNELIDIHGADKKCKLYEEAELKCLKKLIEIVKQK